MRPLILHDSALNDDEYVLYTSSITDLALCDHTLRGDRFYEEITISVRETRAWLKGRYPDIPVVTIDTILKFFSPTLGQGDMLSGKQFFAVLRLVVHVQNGREVDRSLAFVQARPSSPSVNAVAGPPQLSRRSVDSAHNPFSYDSGHHPPVHPSQSSESGAINDKPNNPFVTWSNSGGGSSKLPPLPPRKPYTSASSLHAPPSQRHTSTLPPPIPPPLKPKPIVSPLIQQSLTASKTAKTMKKAEEQLENERVLQVLRSSAVSSPSKRTPAAKSDSSTSSWSGSEDRDKPPALPRRRPRHSPTVSTSSLEQVALATPPRSTLHTASPFDSPARPSVDLPPPTHPDRKPPSLPSASTHIDSARSFEAVYHTPRCSSPTPSPLSPSSATSKPPYSFSVDSATATMPPQQQQSRMFRSRSLHYHRTTTITTTTALPCTGKGPPPVPPPKPPIHSRRKRPESLQVVSPPSSNGGESLGVFSGGGPTTAPVSSFVEAKNSIFAPSPTSSSGHRRSSYSSPFSGNYSSTAGVSGDTTTTGTIQRKLQELQLSAIPVLEKARYKAEAGLSPRRGFIPSASSSSSSGVVNGLSGPGGVTGGGKRSSSVGRSRGEEREGLLLSCDDNEVGQDSGDSDDDNLSGTLRGKQWRAEGPVAVLRDEMKWPPGEGWNRL